MRRVEDLMLARGRHHRQRRLPVLPLPFRRASGYWCIPPTGRYGIGTVLLRAAGAARRVVPVPIMSARRLRRPGRAAATASGAGLEGMDYAALFVTTIGPGVRDLAAQWIAAGQFLNAHILQALALESAEGFAELLHQQMRQMWGIGDPPGLTPYQLFRTQYRGRRFSFGYPACPRLEDQEPLFRALEVSSHLDVALTEGYMMDPESSVSALVFHHPDAKYFNLSEQDIDRLESEIRQG